MLVVDDASAVLDVVTALLVQHGATVTAVGSAEAALHVLRRERPTVLVSALSVGATLASSHATRGVDAASSTR